MYYKEQVTEILKILNLNNILSNSPSSRLKANYLTSRYIT